jgi:hypothetical protein
MLGRVIPSPGTVLIGKPSPIELDHRWFADVHHTTMTTAACTNKKNRKGILRENE